MYLVFRAIECHAVLVPAPISSLQVELDLVSAPRCPRTVRVGVD